MPQGELGNVVKIVNRAGELQNTIGDPSLRSYTGIAWSPADDLMMLDSVIPGTNRPYTLVAATTTAGSETPTYSPRTTPPSPPTVASSWPSARPRDARS